MCDTPFLEGVWVVVCESECLFLVFGCAYDGDALPMLREQSLKLLSHGTDREVGEIDPDPVSIEFLRRYECCATSAERIENEIALV